MSLEAPFERGAMLGLHTAPLWDAASMLELLIELGPPDGAREKAEAAAAALSNIAASFGFDLWNERQPGASAERVAAERLVAACETILKLVGVGCDGEPSPDDVVPAFAHGGLFGAAATRMEQMIGNPGKAATMNHLRAVYMLRLDALRMAEIRAKREIMQAGLDEQAGRAAIKRLVAALSAFYFEVWGKVPTVSRSKANATNGELKGPFVMLMAEVARGLRSRGVPFHWTAEALFRIWRELPPDEQMRLDRIGVAKPSPSGA